MSDKQDPNFQNRRQYKRVNYNFPLLYLVRSPFVVSVRFGQQELDATALDISEGGLCMNTGKEIPPGTLVGLKFTLLNNRAELEQDRQRSFSLGGEVRYSVPDKESGHKVGVLFVSIRETDRRFIHDYVKTQSLQPHFGDM